MDRKVNVSVIIPVYNAGSTIIRAVDSVLMQEFDTVEVILVDDGSTDESGTLCDELALHDNRVKVIHKENGGVSSARNAGIGMAEGEYVMFLDADDALRLGSLSAIYRRGWDMVLAGFSRIEDMSVKDAYVPSGECEYCGADEMASFIDRTIDRRHSYLLNSSCFKLFSLSLIRDHSIRFDENLRYGEDKMFVFSILYHADKVRTVPEIIYDYILQPVSLSSDLTSDGHISQLFLLLELYCPLLELLKTKFPLSRKLEELYHTDVIGRYVCRILTVFARKESAHMTEENISRLYAYMSEDSRLGVFSVRPGQIINILLYKIGRPSFTLSVYRLTSRISR